MEAARRGLKLLSSTDTAPKLFSESCRVGSLRHTDVDKHVQKLKAGVRYQRHGRNSVCRRDKSPTLNDASDLSRLFRERNKLPRRMMENVN